MNSITRIIITVIVVTVAVVGVMIPVTSGLDDNIASVDQNTSEKYLLSANNPDLVVERHANGSYLINGENVTGSGSLFVIGDGFLFQLRSGAYSIYSEGTSWTGDLYNEILTVDDGNYQFIKGNVTVTGTTETLLYPDPRGDYGVYQNVPIVVDKNKPVYVMDRANSIVFVSELMNGTEIDYIVDPANEVSLTFSATATDDGLGYNYSSVQYTSGDYTGYGFVMAPWKYHVVDSNAEVVKSIMNVIPLIVIIGLLIFAGYAIMSQTKRSEL